MAKKRIKPRSAKNKGRILQVWICKKIADLFNVEFDNQDDNSLIQSRQMGMSGLDVILRGHVYESFPFDIEAKNTEKVSLYQFIEQAKSNMKERRNWLVFHKKNNSKPVVIMDAEVFFELYNKILSYERLIFKDSPLNKVRE